MSVLYNYINTQYCFTQYLHIWNVYYWCSMSGKYYFEILLLWLLGIFSIKTFVSLHVGVLNIMYWTLCTELCTAIVRNGATRFVLLSNWLNLIKSFQWPETNVFNVLHQVYIFGSLLESVSNQIMTGRLWFTAMLVTN